MNAWVLMLLPTALGVDFGWERQPDNSIEYIVQIEPEAVDEMKTGTELISSLPPQLRNIRNYRIRVGRERLPNQNILPPEVTTNSAAAANSAPTTTAWGNSTQPNYQTNGTLPGTPNTTGYTTNNSGFVNSSLPGSTGANPYPNPVPTGTASQYYAGTNASNTGVSTSGFPMQNNTSTPYVPTNTGSYAPNVYAPPAGYGNPPTTNNGYATNTNNGQQPNYGPPPYTPPQYGAPSYSQAGYNPNGYVQPGYGPNGYPLNGAPQYLASNPTGASPNLPTDPYYAQGPRLGDPQSYGMQTAKPSIEMPAPSGTPGYGPQYAGQAPNGFPNNSQPSQNDPRFANTGDPRTTIDPNLHNAATTAKIGSIANNDQQSQWASLTFSLIALFASLGANFYLGWTTYHLRERYRMILSDRTTY